MYAILECVYLFNLKIMARKFDTNAIESKADHVSGQKTRIISIIYNWFREKLSQTTNYFCLSNREI